MRAAAAAGLLLFLASCGYVGPVVPPSPQIPAAVTDLNVVAHGDRLRITFTAPPRTTDNLAIRQFSEIELRIGSETQPFDLTNWAASAKEYDIPLPPPSEKDVARPIPVEYTLPGSEFVGHRIAIAVRTAIKKNKNYSSWSNVVRMNVRAPLKPPVLAVDATPQGYSLTFTNEGPDVRYQILRQGPSDQAPIQIAVSDKPQFTDAAPWDTRYIYTVVALAEASESPASNPVTVNQHDKFPPTVPAGLTVVASADSIELSWVRSPETDTRGYYLYRSVNGGPFDRLGDLVVLPAYSDRQVEHGKTYRYQASAIDQNNNESARSQPVEVSF